MDKKVWRMCPGGILQISSDRDDRRIFWGLKFSISGFRQVIFWGAWFNFLGVFETNFSIFGVISFNAFWKFVWLRNSTWDFWGVKFWSRDILGVLFEVQGIFWVLIFAPIQHPCPLGHVQNCCFDYYCLCNCFSCSRCCCIVRLWSS